jgi:hypothetical protein
MSASNYLPIVKRAQLAAAGGLRQAPVRADLDLGGMRAYLSDVAFFKTTNTIVIPSAAYVTVGSTLARIGVHGKGLLTEDFYPLALFNTKPKQEFGVWEFPKPYRLFPGERLSAHVTYNAGAGLRGQERDCTVPAVQFNAVRLADNRPILLHDNANARMTGVAATSIRLTSENLQCPADSPVDIYSCVTQPTFMNTTVANLMIYGPDGRKWWDDATWPFLFESPGFLLDLNKPEWVLEVGQSFYCEFITPAAGCDLTIVVRGQVEVTK